MYMYVCICVCIYIYIYNSAYLTTGSTKGSCKSRTSQTLEAQSLKVRTLKAPIRGLPGSPRRAS